jgi:hypothetical protein
MGPLLMFKNGLAEKGCPGHQISDDHQYGNVNDEVAENIRKHRFHPPSLFYHSYQVLKA